MDNRSKSDIRFTTDNGKKELTPEQIDYLLGILEKAGIDIQKIIKEKELKGEQTINFKDELMIEVYDKDGNLKEKRVIK